MRKGKSNEVRSVWSRRRTSYREEASSQVREERVQDGKASRCPCKKKKTKRSSRPHILRLWGAWLFIVCLFFRVQFASSISTDYPPSLEMVNSCDSLRRIPNLLNDRQPVGFGGVEHMCFSYSHGVSGPAGVGGGMEYKQHVLRNTSGMAHSMAYPINTAPAPTSPGENLGEGGCALNCGMGGEILDIASS